MADGKVWRLDSRHRARDRVVETVGGNDAINSENVRDGGSLRRRACRGTRSAPSGCSPSGGPTANGESDTAVDRPAPAPTSTCRGASRSSSTTAPTPLRWLSCARPWASTVSTASTSARSASGTAPLTIELGAASRADIDSALGATEVPVPRRGLCGPGRRIRRTARHHRTRRCRPGRAVLRRQDPRPAVRSEGRRRLPRRRRLDQRLPVDAAARNDRGLLR